MRSTTPVRECGRFPGLADRSRLCLGRPGHAREISARVTFRASEKVSYATGASFVVYVGLTLMAGKLSKVTAIVAREVHRGLAPMW